MDTQLGAFPVRRKEPKGSICHRHLLQILQIQIQSFHCGMKVALVYPIQYKRNYAS